MLNLSNKTEKDVKLISQREAKTVTHLIVKNCNLTDLTFPLFQHVLILDVSNNRNIQSFDALAQFSKLS